MFGFLNVYKPEGWTSFDVVAKLRKITNIRQIGHTGTLDPFATGVLPVCIGKAAKLIDYIPDDKEYIATVKFGFNTDTYDIEGKITQIFDKKISACDVENILKLFTGDIEQYPPIYSAIKVGGKKLYEYARLGQSVEIKPRKVSVYNIRLISFDEKEQIAKILVNCSKGTYIRSIAYDIGLKLGCGGHLIALERTKAGMFDVDSSVKLEDLNSENIKNYLQNPLDMLPQEKYVLTDQEKEDVSHGRSIKYLFKSFGNKTKNDKNKSVSVVFLVYGGKMYGIGNVEKDRIIIKKVFGEL